MCVVTRSRCLWANAHPLQAFLVENQIATMVADAHSYVTAEGDNIVIMQKTCRDLAVHLGASGGVPERCAGPRAMTARPRL